MEHDKFTSTGSVKKGHMAANEGNRKIKQKTSPWVPNTRVFPVVKVPGIVSLRENKKEEGSVGSCSAENFDRFLKRLDNILKMPNAETPNNTDRTCGNYIEQDSRADAVNPNQQLIDMLRQKNEALLCCMQEIGNLKRKVRQSQTRDA
uniref:Uncharacterized protein n=1 Tax=Glossina palpalis gambiensis TaxID=67801 RepID=A0A1B0BUB0_9MUSC